MLFLLTSGIKGDPFPLARCAWEKQNVNPLTLTLTFVLRTLQQLSHIDTIWHKFGTDVKNFAAQVDKNKTTDQAVDLL